VPPLGPCPRQQHPDDSVDPPEAQPRWGLAPKDGELMAQRENLGGECGPRADRGVKSGQQGDEDSEHRIGQRIDPSAEAQ
jgi:hypothetical protein